MADNIQEILNPKQALSPELKQVESDIRSKAQTPPLTPGAIISDVKIDNNFFYRAPIATPEKLAFETRNYNIDDAYAKLSDGTYIAKYDTYREGANNNEIHAQNQSTGEKWMNGLTKFGGKTLNAIVGGTVGIVYGIGQGVADQSLKSVYDNNFSNWLNDLDTKMNYNLPNYYTQQESQKGLGGQLLAANFWSDKVLGGLSFTAGAIVSEGIWAWATGGTSLATAGARWSTKLAGMGNIAKGTTKFSRLLKNSLSVGDDLGRVALSSADNLAIPASINVNRAIRFGQAGDVANTLRFTMTSAGYEASVEALQYKKEQEELFYQNFQEQNGRQPTQEEITEFETNLTSSANAVFGVNMGLVGSSNLVTLGKVFNLKSPVKTGFSESYNRTLYGIGKTTPSKLQSINRKVLPFIQNSITEGLYEEGGQSITSATAGKWLEHAYDTNNSKESFDLAGALYENISHQYGSKEGWVENGVGMIIGILGEAGTRNTYGGIQRQVQEFENRTKLNETYTQKALSEHFLMMNRVNGFNRESQEAQAEGNLTKSRIAQDGVIFSFLNNRHQLGDSVQEVTQDIQKALETVTQEQLSEMGIDADLNTWKTEQLSAFSEVANAFKKNRQFAEYIIGRNPVAGIQELDEQNKLSSLGANNTQEALIQSLAFTMMGGQRAHTTMKEAVSEMAQILDYEKVKALDTISSLETVTQEKKSQVNIAINASRALNEQRDAIVAELRSIEETLTPDTDKGNKVLRISERLAKVDELIRQNQENLQQLADEINLNNKTLEQTSGVSLNANTEIQNITVEDLKNLDENTKKLTSVLEAIKQSNPENSARLEAILEEYNNSRTLFGNYQNTVLAFTQGKVKIDNINTWVGKKLIKRNASLDQVTKEWLSEMLSDYSGRATEALSELSTITNNTVVVSNETVIDKLRRGETLNQEETEVYETNKTEIDTYIKREVTLPIEPLPTVKSKVDYLKERLSNLLSRTNRALTFIGTSDNDFLVEKPTKGEVERYQELLKQDTLSEEESAEIQQLEQKLSQWRVLDSFVNEEGMSLADLSELIQQQEEEIAQDETITEITEDDTYSMTSDAEGGTRLDDYTLAQNTTGNVTLRRNNNGTVTLHHLSPQSLVDFIGEPFQVTRNDSPIEISQIAIGDIVTTASGLTFKLEAGNIISMSTADFNRTPLIVIRSEASSWTYADVYYFNGSDYVKKSSDFSEDIQAEEIYNLEQGAQVRFEIDRNDPYTKQLLDKYRKNPNDKNRKELTDGIKIFIVSNGKRISTLKGERGNSQDNFKLLREKAFELSTQEDYENDLQATSTVTSTYLGTPQFFVNENAQIEPRPFTESSLGEVLATGYIQNGEITTSQETPKVNTLYVSKVSKKYPQRKLPLVIVKRGVNYVALPIALNTSPLGTQGSQMVNEAISQATSAIEIAKNLNDLINQEGVATQKILPQEVNDETLERIKRDFENHRVHITADELASSNYEKSNLLLDARQYVDADNLKEVISSPKVRIDLTNMLFNQEMTFDTADVKNSVETELDSLAKELYNDFIRNADTKYINSKGEIIENTYTDAFDNESIINSDIHLDKLHNIRMLREAFKVDFSKNKVLRDAIGQEKIERIKILFGILDNISKQVKPNSSTLKSGTNNTKC